MSAPQGIAGGPGPGPLLAMVILGAVVLGGCDCRATPTSEDDAPPPSTNREPTSPGPAAPTGAETASFADAMLREALGKDFSANPALLRRVRGSVHGFFRSVNVSFAECVCRTYGERVRDSPPVNLHGDAHLEQYAVTDEGRGITDFDDATLGPALIDLARFLTSVRIALRQLGWTEHTESVEARFWEGYRGGLEAPDEIPPPPAFVLRLRAANQRPRVEALAAAETLMEPMTDTESNRVLAGIAEYGASRRQFEDALDPRYFEVKSLGRLTMGIGSALDEKYLFRVEGPTADDADDLMLEAKEVRSLEGIPCVFSAQDRNPLRIVLAAERLAYQPYAHAGFYMGPERNFWIHAWQTNYVELSIAPDDSGSLADVDELAAVVYDVGFQLGRGHPKQVGTPIEAQVRPYLVRAVEENVDEASTELTKLADAVFDAWQRFRAQVPHPAD